MSFKAIFLVLIIILTGVFIFLKVLVLGDPGSSFNQTTRLQLGKYPSARLILGLHSYGDARAEYLEGTGPIVIKWFRPQLEEVDQNVLNDFAAEVKQYTGRPTKLEFGGIIDDGVINKDTGLATNKFFGADFSGSVLYVFITNDYRPRVQNELSSTLEEDSIIVSLKSHKDVLVYYPDEMHDYLLSSLLHEFGHQLGLEHNKEPSCIMNAHANEGGEPREIGGGYTETGFCQFELDQIHKMKLRFAN